MKPDDLCDWCGHVRRLHPSESEEAKKIQMTMSFTTYVCVTYCQGLLPETRTIEKAIHNKKGQYIGGQNEQRQLECKCSEFNFEH